MTRGKLLKQLREKKNLTLEEAGKLSGVNYHNISKYENEVVTNIPIDKLELLAKAYDVHPAYIMGWTDNEKGPDAIETDINGTTHLLEELHKNPELRILLSASKDVTPDSLRALIRIAQELRAKK